MRNYIQYNTCAALHAMVHCIDMCIGAPLYITVEISQKLLEAFVQDLVACLKVSQLC